MSIRIAIAEDHHIVVNGIQKILANCSHLSLIDVYQNGDDLLKGLEQLLPDVLLLDIQLPGKTGDKLAPILLKKYPDLRILAFTNFDSVYYAKSMLQHGVLGYLLKSTDQKTLVAAIETVYAYNEFLEPSMKRQIEEKNLKVNRIHNERPILTAREQEVIQLIADGYTTRQIADLLFLSEKTTDNYRSHLLLKFGVQNAAVLIKKAVQMGFVQ